jgi:Icc-related predicted phosphoesterase
MLKDWERYDVSRYVDVGASDPGSGWRSVPMEEEPSTATIQQELRKLVGEDDLSRAVVLFHAPPYESCLDLADLDGQMIDAAPLDVHVGSIAVRRFIEQRRPYLTLHGHVHESARLSGHWRQRIGSTWCLSAAHDGPELAVVRFALEDPGVAERRLYG